MRPAETILAFGVKVIFGCLYGYVFLHYYDGSDTWFMHQHSIKEKQMLFNDPGQFFWEFTPGTAIKNGNDLFEIIALYLRDLEYCVQAKTLGIFNLISNDNYYINAVFWNFIIFWAHYWLYILLNKEFPAKRKLYFILIFLFPPVVFWLSGIRSDGLLFFSISLLLLHFHKWVSQYRVRSFILWIVGFIGILIIRPPVAAILIPALISWWICERLSKKPVLVFLIVYIFAGIIFFASSLLSSSGLPGMVAERQRSFMKLKGSEFKLDTLKPTFKSFARIFPQATVNTFFRPHPFEGKGLLQKISALEIVTFWLIVIVSIVRADREWRTSLLHPMLLVCLFFGASLYIFIGYSIPFPGAIVRYKIIGELMLLCAVVSIVSTGKFR
jgi:hypothetical protein